MASAAPPLVYPHITKESGVCGGRAHIDATRVRVVDVAFMHKDGHSPAEILVQYPMLSLGQVHAALAYYYDHTEEIEAELAEDESWVEHAERDKAEYLSRDRAARP